tara:strand:+ start:67 stop:1470 length:1404 start_codon:yes stop_codon:yes gene_type:complete
LRELTISPDYRQGNVFNPFYDLGKTEAKKVSTLLSNEIIVGVKDSSKEKWKFRNVRQGKGTLLHDFSRRGKYLFQITTNNKEDTAYYIKGAKSMVVGHEGMKQRKDSTASSNINEFLSVYFLHHSDEKAGTVIEAKNWLEGDGKTITAVVARTGNTGILTGNDKAVSYDDLRKLLEKDATPIRDIRIGWNNAREVEKDLGKRVPKILYWTPRGKPGGVSKKNPSDVMILLDDESYIGYSNKATAGKDSTPKFNTNINAFYKQLGDTVQLSTVQTIMDRAWIYAKNQVDSNYTNATNALNDSLKSVLDADYTESNMKKEFADLGRAFNADGLNFFADDFYYPYRNYFIENFSEHLKNQDNLSYFLKTISDYTFAGGGTPCPYKLLVGTEKGSTIKDVSSDDTLKDILEKNSKYLDGIGKEYDGKKQSFKLFFKVNENSVTIPITARTRATGGWAGKSLYIETPGVKVV